MKNRNKFTDTEDKLVITIRGGDGEGACRKELESNILPPNVIPDMGKRMPGDFTIPAPESNTGP